MPDSNDSSENKENTDQHISHANVSGRIDIGLNRNTEHGTYYRAFALADRHGRRILRLCEVKPLQDSNVQGTYWKR